MDEIPRDVSASIENAGWKPGKRINEGGGGTVFTCFQKTYIDLFEKFMNHTRIYIQGVGATNSQFAVDLGSQIISENCSLTPLVGAVKIPHTIMSETIDKRLGEEIRAMASFTHPNLIRLLTCDPKTPPRWFVMDYYPKGTLDHHCNDFRGNPLQALEALRGCQEVR